MFKIIEKMRILILILISIFLTLYKLPLNSVTLTYGDLVGFILLIYFFDQVVKNKLKINDYAKYYGIWLFILLFSSLINLTYLEGPLLNVFKTNLFCLIYFILIYNKLIENKVNIKVFLITNIILWGVFLIKTWGELNKSWGDNGFTNYQVFDSSLNLNTWGFILVLFLILFTYACFKNIYRNYFILLSTITLVLIIYSVSRTSYILSGFIIFWIFSIIKKGKLIYGIIPLLIIILIPYLFSLLPEGAMPFLERKLATGQSDFINTRLYMINIDPILINFDKFNLVKILLGDGLSVQHSFISHNLIVTGLIGFSLYLARYYFLLKNATTSLKKEKSILESKYLILIILVININDFITNLSSFLPFAAYLSIIYLALFSYLTNNEKKNYISD